MVSKRIKQLVGVAAAQQQQPKAVAAPKPSDPNDDLSTLVSGILDTGDVTAKAAKLGVPTDKVSPVADESSAVQQSTSLAATISEQESMGAYAEETQVRTAINSISPAQTTMGKLGGMSALNRAQAGARFGSGIGASAIGPMGGIIGAAVGSIAARSAGLIQSGEREADKRKAGAVSTLNTVGAISNDGFFKFNDGSSFYVNPDPSTTLENTSAATGKAYRSIFDIDASSPFARRSTAVARPLAYYIVNGLMGHNDPKNDQDAKALDNTTALLVNAIQTGAESIQQVYTRGQEIAKQFGVSKTDMSAFFNNIKNNVSDEDALSIKQGLEILYIGDDNE